MLMTGTFFAEHCFIILINNKNYLSLFGQVEINLDEVDIIINNIISLGDVEYSDITINIDCENYYYIQSGEISKYK